MSKNLRPLFCILPLTFFLLSVQLSVAQSLVRLAIELEQRSDSILVYEKDTAFLLRLLQLDLIDKQDTAHLGEMAEFVRNPWNEYEVSNFDISLVDSIWKYKNIGIPERARGLGDFFTTKNPFEQESPAFRQEFFSGGLTDFAPIPSATTRIIEGTAEFIADRFKKELAITFFDNFREKIIADSLFRNLLPQTSSLLIHQDISVFLNIGETERSAFKSDLEELLVNFERFINSQPQYSELSQEIHFRSFMLALKTVDYSLKGYGISELLRVYYMQEQSNNDALGVGIRLLNVFLHSLSDGDYRDLAIVFDNINQLRTQGQRKYFAAMALQRDITLISTLQIEDSTLTPYWDQIDQLIEEFLILSDNLKDQQQTLISKTREGNLDLHTILDYAIYTFDVIDLAARFAFVRSPEKYRESVLFQTALPLARKTIKVSRAISDEDIGLVLLYSSSIIGDLLSKEKVGEHVSTKGYAVEEGLLKYGNFMVNILNAKTSKEVEKAIQAVALPPGAASIKRKTLRSISLNAYPGVYGGVEWLNISGRNTSAAGNLGFSSSVGLSFNWGISKKLTSTPVSYGSLENNNSLTTAMGSDTIVGYELTYLKDSDWRKLTGHSFSIFVSVVDIGAAVSYRLSNDNAEGLPENITLKQIISPGAFFVYGIKNVPISLMGGVQYTPELREISLNQNITDSNALRVCLSLTVDIPLINLYVKQK